MQYNSGSFEDDDIVLRVKKSEIKKFFNGKRDIKISLLGNSKLNSVKTNILIKSNNDQQLTVRELEVLSFMAKGKKNFEIAKELCVSRYTIKAHVASILHKLDVEDRYQAAIKAINEKII